MEPKLLQATTEDTGARIDSFLAAQLDGISRSAAACCVTEIFPARATA